MFASFRLLPITIFFAFALLAFRVGDTIRSGEALFIESVAAQETEKKEAAPTNAEEAAEEPPQDAQVAEEAPAESDTAVDGAEEEKPEAPAEGEPSAGEDAEAKDEGETKAEGEGEKKDKPAPPKDVKEAKTLEGNQLGGLRPDDRRFSPMELELLQQLSDRRQKLDAREGRILENENLLSQTETRIDEKVVALESLKTQLTEMLALYTEQEDKKIRSLVKIYENMKPRDAARIFDEVEMPVLLLVIDKMSEKKAAPILAGMNAKKAKQLTVELAEQRRLQDMKLQKMKEQQNNAPAARPESQ